MELTTFDFFTWNNSRQRNNLGLMTGGQQNRLVKPKQDLVTNITKIYVSKFPLHVLETDKE
jgi:hypothetical protein